MVVWGVLPNNITPKPASQFLYNSLAGIAKPSPKMSSDFKAILIGTCNYVSGPPLASFFGNMKFQKYMGKIPASKFEIAGFQKQVLGYSGMLNLTV